MQNCPLNILLIPAMVVGFRVAVKCPAGLAPPWGAIE
jgi:hypothetical protein